jgi:Tfp pilus assembly protein PilO
MTLKLLSQMPKDKLQKIVLVCIVTVAVGAIVMQFYVLKNWAALRDADQRLVKIKEQISDTEHRLKQAAQNQLYREQVSAFVESQQAAMVAGDPFAWVVREISLLAEQHPLRVTSLLPGGKIEAGVKSKSAMYTTRIDLIGNYDQIGTFIRDLENKFPTAEVRSLTVSGSPDDKGRHMASLNLALLVQPEQPVKTPEGKTKS